jgi:glycosyltransferase involved in cell wall biosynthesis
MESRALPTPRHSGARHEAALVSVIVPCYNAGRYVAEAVTSALAQTYPAVEVIVIDDGSQDDSRERLAAFGDRIRVITQPNRGVSAARNRGIAESRGEFLAYLDADDVWHRSKIEYQVRAIGAAPGAAFVHTRHYVIDNDGQPVPFSRPGQPRVAGHCFEQLIRANGVLTSSVLHRRSALAGHRFPEQLAAAEDWDVWLALAAGGEVIFIDFPFTGYRLHGANTSRQELRMCEGRILALDLLLGRPLPARARRIARDVRRDELRYRAQLLFDQGERREARAVWRQVLGSLTLQEWKRLFATYVPDAVFSAARARR